MGLEWPQGHVKMSNLAEINAGRIDEVLNDPPSLSYDTGRKYYVLSSQHRRPYVASPEVNDKSFTRSSDSVALSVYTHITSPIHQHLVSPFSESGVKKQKCLSTHAPGARADSKFSTAAAKIRPYPLELV